MRGNYMFGLIPVYNRRLLDVYVMFTALRMEVS